MDSSLSAAARGLRILLPLLLLALAGCRFPPWGPAPPPQTEHTAREGSGGTAQGATIVFEEPGLPQPAEVQATSPEKKGSCGPPPPPGSRLPRVAIIIDDMGYHRRTGDRLLGLDMDLTFSFLPGAPFTAEQEEKAFQRGRDILVHLPMEARDPKWDPGPGKLLLSFSPRQMRETVRSDLAAVPHAIGANNHMGSRFTEDRRAMRVVLSELKKHNFFFIDSYTTAASTGMAEAAALGMPTGRRHVFLDNVHSQDTICRQLKQLIRLAEQQGWAIGIGHPNQATLDALTRCREKLLRHVRLVGVHALVR